MKYSRNVVFDHTYKSTVDFLQSFENRPNYFLAMFKETSLIGTATLYCRPEENAYDIGILIGYEFSGKGLGFECFSALAEIVRIKLGFSKFTAGTHQENKPMLSIFEKMQLHEITGMREFHRSNHRYFEGTA